MRTTHVNEKDAIYDIPNLLAFITSKNNHSRIAKRLDEHRELVCNIIESTTLFQPFPYAREWAKTNDDYLVEIYCHRYGYKPKMATQERFSDRMVFMPRPNYDA